MLVLILHIISFAMVLGIAWARSAVLPSAAEAEGDVREALSQQARRQGQVSMLWMVMAWITGIILVGREGGWSAMPAQFWLKAVFALLLTGLLMRLWWHGYHHQMHGRALSLREMRVLSVTASATGVAIVVLTVLARGG